MNLSLSIDLSTVGLRGLTELLGPSKLPELHNAMGEGVREVTRDYLQELSMTRHPTADRLGAEYSGHLGQAARAVEGSPVTSDSQGATLTINHVGMIRALRDVTIVPVTGKALAIPVDALAYNRRPAQFGRDAFFVWKSKVTGNAFLAKRQENKGDPLQLMYLLVRSVTQKQDRTLLPSDEAWSKAAADAARTWFDLETEKANASLS